MLFNSMDFWAFFAVVVAAYFALPHRARWVLLLVASCVFYMRWNAAYILVIVASALVDFVCGLVLGDSFAAPAEGRTRAERGWVVTLSLIVNLAILFFFKYSDFFHDSMTDVCLLFGVHYARPALSVILPVGISFHTFQAMAYTVDVYRRDFPKPERHVGIYVLYILFFPQLVAGPIERASNLLHQFRIVQRWDWARVTSGMQLALWGLFKKTVIADRLAIAVDTYYGAWDTHNGVTLALATYCFAFQIYCDFSGYSDIAVGIAKVLGIDLMQNFRRPYFSTSITEFWRRWHISLSNWLRDYLYIPLGGNRGSSLFMYRNLMITMVLGGLWHGASWNFVVWGALQGAMLSVSRATLAARTAWSDRLGIPPALRDGLRMIGCFHLVCLSWIFFRADTIHDALGIVGRIGAGPWGAPFLDPPTLVQGGFGVAVLLAAEVVQARVGSLRAAIAALPGPVRWAGWYALGAAIVLLGVQAGSQFIYFQF